MNPINQLSFSVHDCINDVEVGPEHVPLSLLTEFQKDVSEFLRGSSRDIDVNQVQIAIESGSLKLIASGLLSATTLWHDLAQLEKSASLASIDPKRAGVVKRWQAQAKQNSLRQYTISNPIAKTLKVLVLVNRQSTFKKVDDVWVSVEKYMHGKIIDLGGKTRANVHLEMETGESITISASRELLAQEEKNRLYREAVLHVSAQENLATGELRNMQLIGFEPYHSRYDEDAFKLMVERGTKAWADVPDSDEWLESFRGNRA